MADLLSSIFSAQPGTATSTQTTEPWGPQQQYLLQLLQQAQQLYSSGQLGQVAGFTPLEQQGQAAGQRAASDISGLLPGTTDAFKFLLQSPDVANNPYVNAYADAAVQPLQKQLLQSILPSISANSFATGNTGSSRQGVAEGLALQGFTDTAANTRAQIFNNAYGQGLGASQGALGLLPTLLNAYMTPSNILTSIGQSQRGLNQAQLDQPGNALNLFKSFISGNYGGTTTTQTPYQTPSLFQQGVGLASQAFPIIAGANSLGLLNFGTPPALPGIGGPTVTYGDPSLMYGYG